MAILVTWATAFVFLAAMGGGLFVWAVCLVGITAAAGWALIPAGVNALQTRAHVAAALAVAGLIALAALSLLPLPDSFTGLSGEPRATQHLRVAAALKTAAQIGLPKVDAPDFAMTRNMAGTGRILALMLAAVCMAFLASRLDERGRRGLLAFLSLSGTIIAILGYFAQNLTPQGDTLWWWIPVQHALPGPVACFGNRNHFAGFLAVLSVVSLAACLYGVRARKIEAIVVHGVAFSVMAVELVLTMSRGALLAWTAGMAVVIVLGLARRAWAVILMALLVAGVLAGAAAALPRLPLPPRYKTLVKPFETSSALTRLHAWRDSLRIWVSYPVTGAGANGYRTVFPQHRRTTEGAFATYPENLYVQILAETGAIGALLVLVFLCAGARISLCRWRSNDSDRTSVIAGLGAGTVALTHGMVDVPLQVPLYAVTAATLAGILLFPAPRAESPASFPRFRLLFALPPVLVAGFLGFMSSRLRTMDAPTYLEYAGARDVQTALVWAPSSWHAWYYLGRHAFMLHTPEATRFGAQCMMRAGECDPNNYRLWLEIGKAHQGIGDIEGARAAFKRVRELRDWVPIPALPEPAT